MIIRLTGQFIGGDIIEWQPNEIYQDGTEYMVVDNMRYERKKDSAEASFIGMANK